MPIKSCHPDVGSIWNKLFIKSRSFPKGQGDSKGKGTIITGSIL